MAAMRADLLSERGSAQYRSATTPHNSSVVQQPAAVARPTTAEEVAEVVRWAADRDLVVVVQASGHGAGARVGGDQVLVDTSALNGVQIETQARSARVGAGATWSAVNAVAEKHGLFGLAGSSPTVAVAGYTFGGGIGWLTRPHGMASSALLAVDYVDGGGHIRRAADDAPDPVDRAALWAFRGGGGIGVATALSFDLVAPPALWAGYMLWEIAALQSVVDAWAAAMGDIGQALATSISVLHTPPGPPFPPALQGVPIVHLAFASPTGEHAAAPLLRALRSAPSPTVDSHWAPADSARLAEIHLDPPGPVPALGLGRWLGSATPALAGDLLTPAAVSDSPLALIELRNVGNSAPTRAGAMTAVPSPFLLHAVGVASDPESRNATEQGLSQVHAAAQSADIGLAAASFAEGRAAVADGLDTSALRRLVEVRTCVDPDRRIASSRILAAVEAM
jgi:FAD binding domain